MKNNNTSVEQLTELSDAHSRWITKFETDLCIKELQPSSLLPDTHRDWQVYLLKYTHEYKKWKIKNAIS